MRFLIVSLFALLFAASPAAAQTPVTDSTFIIAYIDGLPAGWAKLVGSFGDQSFLVDSARIDTKGRFMLRRKPPLKPGYYYFILPEQKNFAFLIEEERKIIFRGNAADLSNTLSVEGCPNADLFIQTNRWQSRQEVELRPLNEQLLRTPQSDPNYAVLKAKQNAMVNARKNYLDSIFKANPKLFFTKFKIAGQNPDLVDFRKPNGDLDTIRQLVTYRNNFFENVDFSDERLLYTPVIANKLRRFMKELTPQRPDSLIKVADGIIRKVMPYKQYFQFFSNWIAIQYENGKTSVMDGEAVYVHIVKTFMTPELAFWSKKEETEALQKHVWEMEASLMGKKGPDVTAKDVVDGKTKSIYEMTSPLVVVFMFSPDCEHCQKDAPKIKAIADKWKDKGVSFYGIAIGSEDMSAKIKEFVTKNRFTFPVVNDPTNRAIYAKYFVDITPELYVLNPNRTIVSKNLHAEQLEEVFEKELRKIKK